MSSPLSADSVRLRPFRNDAAEADAILDAFASAPDMARQGDVHDRGSAAAQAAWLAGDGRRTTALAGPDDRLLGIVGAVLDEQNRSAWIFYWLHACARRQGLMSRAAATVCEQALLPAEEGGWGLERLELGHRVNNPASGAVARAAGFVLEGREREKFLIDGERIDVLAYGRLAGDPRPSTPHLPWSHDHA